jgi:signal peptidase I
MRTRLFAARWREVRGANARQGAILAVLSGFAGVGLILAAAGRPYIVVSGSMEPAIHAGDLFWLAPLDEEIDPGTVITFRMGESIITHRVIAAEGGAFITQGDSNLMADPWPVPRSAILGTPVLRVPYLGALLEVERRLVGLFLVSLILPAVLFGGEVVGVARGERHSLKEGGLRGRARGMPAEEEGLAEWRASELGRSGWQGPAIRRGQLRSVPHPCGVHERERFRVTRRPFRLAAGFERIG